MSEFFTDGEEVGIHYRSHEIGSGDIDAENRTVKLTFSSETSSVERRAGVEILDHGKD